MTQLFWHDVEDFPSVDLKDSFVLSWTQSPDGLVFELDASIWPGHQLYEPPKPGEHTCYKRGRLIFPHAHSIRGLRTMAEASYTRDPDGSIDYGTIEALLATGTGRYRLCGDFGDVYLESEEPKLVFNDDSA